MRPNFNQITPRRGKDMNQDLRITIGLMLIALLAACSPPPPSSKSVNTEPPPPPAAPVIADPPPMPAPSAANPSYGSMVVYSCDDGKTLTVTYDEHSAMVKLPTGSTTLSRAEEASTEGRDAYLGEELSLYRDGDMVQLETAGKSRICTESPTSG